MNPIAVDIDTNRVVITLEKTDTSIYDLWDDYFKDKEVTAFLSGGIDSQFSTAIAQKYAKSLRVITFAFTWEDNVINATDIVMAQRYCHRNNIDIEIVEIDLESYFNERIFTDAIRFNTISPQITAHLAAIESLNLSTELIVLGGEIPLIGIGIDNGKAIIGTPHASNEYYSRLYQSYHNLGNIINTSICKDPFHISPESLYHGYIHNKKVIDNTRKVFYIGSKGRSNSRVYKQLYYFSYNFSIIPQLQKQTGFEVLKQHLATKTGRYDEFNIQYRHPLKNNLGDQPTSDVRFTGYPIQNILEEVQEVINRVNPEICNTYNFDW